MKISIILSTFNRAELLSRGLYTYLNQSLATDEFEIIICDDESSDNTKDVIEYYKNKLNLIYIKLKKGKSIFRAQTIGWNIGLLLAIGEVAIFSHPEIMMPYRTLQVMYEPHLKFDRTTFLTMVPCVLSEKSQNMIDSVDWKQDVDNIKLLPGFYTDSWKDGNRILTNKNMEEFRDKKKWESNTTFSMKRIDMISIGGLDEFDRWGPDDPSFMVRRRKLKIPTSVCEVMNYHQNHDAISKEIRKQDFKVKWYPTANSARIRLKDHVGEFEVVSSYRPY